MSEYTPTTGEIRYRIERDWEPYGDGSFDRWLAAHDAEVRREEREKVAREIEAVADSEPQIIGFRCTFPGPRESGLRAAARIARGES